MRLIWLPLLLAACAQAPERCTLRKVGDMPALLDQGRLEVPARVNGGEARLVIDTGAERSALSAVTVGALLLARSQRSATRLSGVTGIGAAVSSADAYAQIDLGGAHRDGRIAVADLPGLGGLIGADVLSAYDVELDLSAGRVRLWQAAGCGPADLPWTGPRETLPVEVASGGRLRLPVLVDSTPLTALLDSGASVSLLSGDAARRLGVTPQMLEASPGGVGQGAGAGVIAVRTRRFASLVVGQETTGQPRLAVAEAQLGGAQMLLGLDWLRGRRTWIDYRDGSVFVQAGK